MGVAVYTSVGGAGRGRGSGPLTPWPEHCWVLRPPGPGPTGLPRGRPVGGAGQRARSRLRLEARSLLPRFLLLLEAEARASVQFSLFLSKIVSPGSAGS